VPVYEWEGRRLLRVSVGPYSDESDLNRLVHALAALL
jgi:selenocysteine lyase/cysteine desulfurase